MPLSGGEEVGAQGLVLIHGLDCGSRAGTCPLPFLEIKF